MEELNDKTKVWGLSLKEFLEHSTQERPNITGGCILLTNATLISAMILMALKISIKKTRDSAAKRFLKHQATTLKLIQAQLSAAATNDLLVFDDYRDTLKSKSKNRDIKLNMALKRATDSLLDASMVLQQAILTTSDCKAFADSSVLSDLAAGDLVFKAINNAILILAESNISLQKT